MTVVIIVRMLFIIFSIGLIAVSVIVANRAYHLKGQRFAFGVLFSAGLMYLAETVRYTLPIEYSGFILFAVVGGLALFTLCHAAHYIYYLVTLQAVLKIRFVPHIFYVPLYVYLGVIGPLELITAAPYEQINYWFVQETIGYRLAIFFLVPICFVQLIYLLSKGVKYAPSEKRKTLFVNYMYGAIASFVLSLVCIAMIQNVRLPAETFLLICFVPLLIYISIENYLFSPGFTKHYHKIIELSPVALLVLNRDFEVVEINDRATQWFKAVKDEPIHHFIESEENLLAMMHFLTTLQMEREVMDYPLTMTFHETVHFSVVASIFEIEEQYYYYLMIRDVTKEREQEQLNYHLAYHDTLTDLHNRAYFNMKIQEILDTFSEQHYGVLVLSDLNFFKQINDTYGHSVGDEVLKHTARIFNEHIQSPNILARLGGDEFIFYLDVSNEEQAHQLIEKIRFQFSVHPYIASNHVIEIVPSFGYTIIQPEEHYEAIYHRADVAMYEDKARVKQFYKTRTQNESFERV